MKPNKTPYEAPLLEVLEIEMKRLICDSIGIIGLVEFDGANAGEFEEELW